MNRAEKTDKALDKGDKERWRTTAIRLITTTHGGKREPIPILEKFKSKGREDGSSIPWGFVRSA